MIWRSHNVNYNSFFIPGLGMNIGEVKLPSTSFGLQNPGFAMDNPVHFSQEYDLEAVASFHLIEIIKRYDRSKPLTLVGMSLGGMILSIIAAKFRHHLPEKTNFIFYMTSSNSKSLPLLSQKTLESWSAVKPGDEADFARILRPFFSSKYIKENEEQFNQYVRYRAHGYNRQTGKAYLFQLGALLRFDGDECFSSLNSETATFFYGEEDFIVNHEQMNHLKSLSPMANHVVIPALGHMIHIERPDLILKDVG